ncbi:MAG TPA: DUF3175 domain-containing protein [Paraburkholderia sp.]|jgi:hypothetical protein|nr:DUF3175 domain-containing protein [Paraburkholderia sp.]
MTTSGTHSHRGTSARHRRRRSSSRAAPAKRWSRAVNERSDAMDIEPDIFKQGNAREIAASLKRSSTASRRRKGTPFQSAMSMLNFHINRAGRNLPKARRNTLQSAKRELRVAFGRKP